MAKSLSLESGGFIDGSSREPTRPTNQNGPKKQIHGRYGATGRLFALLFAYYLLTIGSCCITCAESSVQLRSMGNPRWKWKLSLACSTFGSSYILYIYIYTYWHRNQWSNFIGCYFEYSSVIEMKL